MSRWTRSLFDRLATFNSAQTSSLAPMNDEERAIYNDLFTRPTNVRPFEREPQLQHRPPGNPEESWQNCNRLVEAYDADMCKAYREQIDTLMVFAGLFSGVVTAFTVESYQWLRADSGDRSAEMLAQIVTLLAHNQSSSSMVTPIPSFSSEPTLSASTAARINVYWFLSLTVSLSAALIGILCKQWLWEYERIPDGVRQETSLTIRHMKYQGLLSWRVGSFIDSMPIILQLSLGLFLLGIAELLNALNLTVAVPVIIVVALIYAFYITTTLAPAVMMAFQVLDPTCKMLEYHKRLRTWSHCPYKSPQAWVVLRALHAVLHPIVHALNGDIFNTNSRIPFVLRSWSNWDRSWDIIREGYYWAYLSAAKLDRSIPDDATLLSWFSAVEWIVRTFHHENTRTCRWVWHCVFDQPVGLGAENISILYPRVVVTMEFLLQSRLHGHYWMCIIDGYKGTPVEGQMITLAFTAYYNGGLDVVVELYIRIATGPYDPGLLWTVRCVRMILSPYAGSAVFSLHQDPGFTLSHDLCFPLRCVAESRMEAEILHPSADPDVIQSLLVNIAKLLSSSNAPAESRFLHLSHICHIACRWLLSATRNDGTGLLKNSDTFTLKRCARVGMLVLLRVLGGPESRQFSLPETSQIESSAELIRALADLAMAIAHTWPAFYLEDWGEIRDDPEFRSTYFQPDDASYAYVFEGCIPWGGWHAARFRSLVDFGRAQLRGTSPNPGFDDDHTLAETQPLPIVAQAEQEPDSSARGGPESYAAEIESVHDDSASDSGLSGAPLSI